MVGVKIIPWLFLAMAALEKLLLTYGLALMLVLQLKGLWVVPLLKLSQATLQAGMLGF